VQKPHPVARGWCNLVRPGGTRLKVPE